MKTTCYCSDHPDINFESLDYFDNGLHYAIYPDSNDNNSNSNLVYHSSGFNSTRRTPSSSVRVETAVLSIHGNEQQFPSSLQQNTDSNRDLTPPPSQSPPPLLLIWARSQSTPISVRLSNCAKMSDMLRSNARRHPNRFEKGCLKLKDPYQRNCINYSNANENRWQHNRSQSVSPRLFYTQQNLYQNSYDHRSQKPSFQTYPTQQCNVAPISDRSSQPFQFAQEKGQGMWSRRPR